MARFRPCTELSPSSSTQDRWIASLTRFIGLSLVERGAADYTLPRRPDGTRAYAFDSSKVHTFDLTQPQVGGRFPEVGTGTTAAPGSGPPVASGAKSTAEALLSFGGQFARGHLLVDGSQRAQVRDER